MFLNVYILYPEKDVNGDTLWVWCYPSVGSEQRRVLLSKCCLTQDTRDFHTFVFGQFCRTWYYITTLEVHEPTALNKVQRLYPPLSHPRSLITVSKSNNGAAVGRLSQRFVFLFIFAFLGHSFFSSCHSKRFQP